MKHEITSHKAYTCQGRPSHKPNHSLKAQTAIETGPTTRKKPCTCPTISVVKAHSMTFRAVHLNIKLRVGVTRIPQAILRLEHKTIAYLG